MGARRPNILFVLTDQQRADTIHAGGNSVIQTPALDRLCAEGVRFENAFTPSPVCVPARGSIIYGQYPQKTKCYSNADNMPTDKRATFMQVLTENGYRTHGIGKMHFTPDAHALRGFQTRESQEELPPTGPQEDDYFRFLSKNGLGHLCEPHGVRGEMYYIPQLSSVPAPYHPAQWVGDRAVAFLQEHQPQDQPWFLWTSFVDPHPPFTPPNPWHKLYRAPHMPFPMVPENAESLLLFINHFQNRYKYRDRGIDGNLLRCIKAYYYACISFVDYQIGRIVGFLEERGELDNTLIVFTSDHGEYLGDYNCFGKRGMHNAAARVPLIVRYPERFSEKKTCDQVVSLVDVGPTLLNAAGLDFTTHSSDGLDLASIGTGECERQYVFSQYQIQDKAIYMIVSKEWKYFYSAPDNQEYLFDRSADPQETQNFAGVSALRDTKSELQHQLFEYLRSRGETNGLEGDNWKVFPRQTIPDDPDAGLIFQDPKWVNTSVKGYT